MNEVAEPANAAEMIPRTNSMCSQKVGLIISVSLVEYISATD